MRPTTLPRLLALLLAIMLVGGCDRLLRLPPPGPQQVLVVGLPGAASDATAVEVPGHGSMAAFQRELSRLLAVELEAGLKLVVATDQHALMDKLRAGRIHLAAGLPGDAGAPDVHIDLAFCPTPQARITATTSQPCGWAFAAGNAGLAETAANFIAAIRADGTLRQIEDRHFGHLGRLDDRAIEVFLGHVAERLPQFRRLFQEAQVITGIDWRLLAALGYQESKWDPLAVSPTGVRGLMMLTGDTADRMGVQNRFDAAESIRAGAKYLALLMDDLPNEVKPPDRLWLALAAYNLGMGHLNGGRQFAPGLGRDPNLWVDMKEVLPLLARPQYYERLKSGRARGGEAVIMVESIRNYHDLLARLEPAWTPADFGAHQPGDRRQRAGVRTSSPPR